MNTSLIVGFIHGLIMGILHSKHIIILFVTRKLDDAELKNEFDSFQTRETHDLLRSKGYANSNYSDFVERHKQIIKSAYSSYEKLRVGIIRTVALNILITTLISGIIIRKDYLLYAGVFVATLLISIIYSFRSYNYQKYLLSIYTSICLRAEN